MNTNTDNPISHADLEIIQLWIDNHIIQTTDYDKWKVSPAQLSVYKYSDFNLDGSVQTTDYDKWYINKSKIGIAELGY